MPEKLTEWRVFCVSEDKWVYKWLPSDQIPVNCFNNETHDINQDSFQATNTTVVNSVSIVEEEIPTGGFFRSEGFKMTIPPETTEILQVEWPYPVGVLDCNIQTTISDIGNVINGVVGPNTIIGVLEIQATAGNTVVSVPASVVENVHIGIEFLIGGEEVGEIVSINNADATITLDSALVKTFSTGALIGGQRRIIKNFYLGYTQGCAVGSSKIGASYIPSGVKTKVIYKNNSTQEKIFNFNIEYLY